MIYPSDEEMIERLIEYDCENTVQNETDLYRYGLKGYADFTHDELCDAYDSILEKINEE